MKTVRLKFAAKMPRNAAENTDEYVGLEHVKSWTGKLQSSADASQMAGDGLTARPGDVLFGKLRPYLAKVWEVDRTIACSSEFAVIRPRERLNSRFLSYVLLDRHFVEDMNALTYGAKMPRVSPEEIGEYEVPLPEIGQQQQIAGFLDRETAKIDALIEKKQRLLELLDEKRTALITRIVTKGLDPDVPLKDSGVEWIGVIPKHWEVIQLRRACRSAIAGPFGSSLTKDIYGGDRYRVYGQQQVIPNDFAKGDYYIPEGVFRDLRRFETKPGDLLISCMGTVGKAAVVPKDVEPGIINPRLVRLRVREKLLGPSYVPLVLRSEPIQYQIKRMSRGGTMGGLNLTIVSQIMIPLPPVEEQEKIKSFLGRKEARLDRLANKIRDAIKLLQEYRTTLISAAVTGAVDEPKRGKSSPARPLA